MTHLVTLACFLTVVCSYEARGLDFTRLDAELRAVITDRASADADLLQAISRLGPVHEPPQFWTRIANDESYSLSHRNRAVFALFRRHVPVGTLSELSKILAPAKWAEQCTINEIELGLGDVPVEQNPGQSVFLISPFSRGGIYLRLLGPIDLQTFKKYVKGDVGTNPKPDPAILEIGYSDDYYEWLKRPHVPKREP